MTIFRNFKNQSVFYDHIWHHVSRMSIKQFEIPFKPWCTKVKKSKNTHVIKMEMKRIKIALVVLDAVMGRFPET